MSADARVDYPSFRKLAPAAYAALTALGNAVEASGLDNGLTELVKIRASQLNGCAFCLQYHLTIARKAGVAAAKLDLVAAWKDAGIFSDRECAALAWTECLTDLATAGAPDGSWAALLERFSETEAVFLTVAIGTINAWNRLGVGLRFPPPLPASLS